MLYQDFTATPIYNQAALGYPPMGQYNFFEVPMHLESYKAPTRSPSVIPWQSIPAIDSRSNLAYLGFGLAAGPSQAPKIALQGHIDTPFADDGSGNELPLIERGGFYIMYHDLIAMCMEGRYVQGNYFSKVEPLFFRDPFGRVFSSPSITAFTGNYVEGRPGRVNFSMTLAY